MTWQEWLRANYDPKKPVTIQIGFRNGWKQAKAESEVIFALMKGENK